MSMQKDELRVLSALQPPPVEVRCSLSSSVHNLGYTTRTRRFAFMSQSRDVTLYPTPSFYRVVLPVPQKNVIGIGLNLAVLPLTEYNVNEYNQWLDVDANGTLVSVELPTGIYTLANLAAGLQAALVAASPALAAYTVALSPTLNKITINTNNAAAPCTLLFGTGPNLNRSLWQVLGFVRGVDTFVSDVQAAPGVVDLLGALAVDMFIDEIKTAIGSADNAFARIDLYRTQTTSDATFFTPPGDGLPLFFWPIARLTFLTFRFLVKYSVLEADGSIRELYRPYLCNYRNNAVRLDIVTREYKSPLEDSVELEATG